MESPNTVPGLLLRALRESPHRTFLRVLDAQNPSRGPIPWTYEEFGLHVRRAIAFLKKQGLGPDWKVLILGENSPEWQVLSLAAQCLRARVFSAFAVLGEKEVQGIVHRVRPDLLVAGNRRQLEKFSPSLQGSYRPKCILILEGECEGFPGGIPYSELFREGGIPPEELASLADSVQGEDIFLTLFTSGTTGRFKGVNIGHRAFLASLEGGATTLGLGVNGLGLLFLPFGHVAGQCHFYVAMKTQSSLIFCPDRKCLLESFRLGPTYTLLVPFFFERLFGEVLKKIDRMGRPWRRLFLRMVEALSRKGMGRALSPMDRLRVLLGRLLLGKKIHAKLGGKIRILVSAGASLDQRMVGFFRGLGIEFLNYYGMSESAGTIALDSVLDRNKKIGSTGKPWRGVEVHIAEDGEILVRGATLFSGYLEKEDEEGAYVDGYFRTGDLGRLDEDGYLFVTGRKKNLVVLRTGEKVAAEAIELQLQKILPIEAAIALGNNEGFLSAAVFVSREKLGHSSDGVGLKALELEFLARIQEEFSGMSDFAVPERVLIIPGSPADYPDLVTPTLKIKRGEFFSKFKEQIDRIYGRRQDPAESRGIHPG